MEFNSNDPSRLTETFSFKIDSPNQLKQITESTGSQEYLLPRIEAIHAGSTRNHNHYLAEKLKGDPVKKTGVYSWTHPYAKPVIYNHDTNTAATGRVEQAAYTEYTQAGKPGIIIIPKITDPDAIQALKDGRLLTVSVGATTDSIICSITGKDIMKEGFTGYEKGQYYDGKLCEWIIGDIWFDEVSWVNVPADQTAQVVDLQTSVFLDTPSQEGVKESATRSLQETFGVPQGVPIVVPGLQEETDNNTIAENARQEESEGMDKAEKDVIEEEILKHQQVEEEASETEDKEKVSDEEEVETEETEVDPEQESEELSKETEDTEKDPEEDEAKEDEAEEQEEEDKVAPKTAEGISSEKYSELLVENAGLKSQNDALIKELKENYIQGIMAKTNIRDEVKESFTSKLSERTLDSLRDKLNDLMEEESLSVTVKEEKVARAKTPKVDSPLPTGVEESASKRKTFTEDDRVNFLSSLLK